jgi:hypothetical protein
VPNLTHLLPQRPIAKAMNGIRKQEAKYIMQMARIRAGRLKGGDLSSSE